MRLVCSGGKTATVSQDYIHKGGDISSNLSILRVNREAGGSKIMETPKLLLILLARTLQISC